MKHLDQDARSTLSRLIDAAGLQVPAKAQSLALKHLEWVLEENLTLNLTSVTDPLQAIRLHTLDSLMVLPEIVSAPSGMMIDLGSGAGFPGVPLALATGRRTLLLDSVGKKARAVEQFVRQAGLGVAIEVRSARAEELELGTSGRAGIVVARAVSSLPALVELASPLLVQGGRLVAMKGRADESEVRSGEAVCRLTGMLARGHREYVLPGGDEQRSVYVYERAGQVEVDLPRRTGLAQRRPLA